jgi:hypothetical protein
MLAPKEKWRELVGLQKARRDFPLREFITILVLIVSIWVVDVFFLRDAYDKSYFIVQRTVRKAGTHCRDMVIDRQAKGIYAVQTCGKVLIYKVRGDRAFKIHERRLKDGQWSIRRSSEVLWPISKESQGTQR